ncbi:GldG family protein [Leptolyngbya sp. NIES-2104]|uniref:GldG family protein n=1 Tax=Leptolyngbya sp. NIES-2104 TaxID=1552121 RepID=UPI0006ECBD0E|nr:Gldg family protein [Leptolyngbya sp. NIES-2104]GAP97859.1 mucin 2 precursor [Leptolyngbya sp. NIES-2104]
MKRRFSFVKFLILPGAMLILAGISAGIVSGTWGSIPFGLIIAGIVLIGLWMVLIGRFEDPLAPTFWKRRSTQASTNALVSTIAVLVILGLINFLAVRAAQRIDLTESRLFTLSPESQQVLQEMQQGVKIWVFSSDRNPQDVDLLENYQRRTPKFSFEFVDPQANPGLAQAFGVKNAGDVFIELQSSKRRQFLQSISPQARLSESRVTNGILQITSDRRSKAYFLQGHGEKSLTEGEGAISNSVKALEDKNFTNEPLNLAQLGRVPSDASAVLVIGPTRTLPEGEVKALQDYSNQGGNLLIAVDPNVKAGLDPFLNTWGVKLDDRIAINAPDQQLTNAGPAVAVVTQYGAHPITKDFGNGISFYPIARPIDITQISGVQATPLLLTDPNSWAESNIKQQPLKLDGGDRPGPLAISVALDRTVTPTPSPSPTASPSPNASPSPSPSPLASKPARLVVFGNSTFIVNGFSNQQLNGDVFLNSVTWVSQDPLQPLSIRPKDVKNRRIVLNNEQALLIGFLALGIVPLFGFITAGVVWWQRR